MQAACKFICNSSGAENPLFIGTDGESSDDFLSPETSMVLGALREEIPDIHFMTKRLLSEL